MLRAALEGSTAVRFLESLPDRAETAFEASGLRTFGTAVGRYVRASYCYRWLTAEPEPDVIVIDLRDTYTVGPIVRLLEATGDALEDGYARSRTESVVSATAEAVRAHPIRTLGAVGLACVPPSLLALTLVGSLSIALFAGHVLAAVLSAAALRSTRSLSALLESRPVALLAAALEPPEPPDSGRASETDGPGAANRTGALEESAAAETTNDETEP
ncbi:hypothetical protein [Natrinema salaciae]|uniref:Uncharacterized protein n=1 Tax=Natrinema salaciae TaxID=1186196 RepID=A0A1H8ZY53_9EURY|nr:hypothetical protein [Natrinema salaciae]SEP69436.1 hypothetical protein SAMN04489841_0298 [Natrinema salaciae]